MISIINFAHSDPLYLAFEGDSTVKRANPLENLRKVLSGEVEIAVVSLVSYIENSDSLKLLPTANINTLGKTISTLLISRKDRLQKSIDVAITRNTRTTEFFLDLILRRMKIDHRFIHTDYKDADDLLGVADYALLNGDEALAVYASRYNIIMDIGRAFSYLYGMSPVYAVSVSRKDSNPDYASIDRAVERSVYYRPACSAALAERLKIPRAVADDYYSVIRYEFDLHVKDTVDWVSRIYRSKAVDLRR